jgi:hypothetical protein
MPNARTAAPGLASTEVLQMQRPELRRAAGEMMAIGKKLSAAPSPIHKLTFNGHPAAEC